MNDKAFRAAFAMQLVTQSDAGGKSALVRLFIAACTYYGLVLPLVFTGHRARFNGLASDKERNWLLCLGLAISLWGSILSGAFWILLAYSYTAM